MAAIRIRTSTGRRGRGSGAGRAAAPAASRPHRAVGRDWISRGLHRGGVAGAAMAHEQCAGDRLRQPGRRVAVRPDRAHPGGRSAVGVAASHRGRADAAGTRAAAQPKRHTLAPPTEKSAALVGPFVGQPDDSGERRRLHDRRRQRGAAECHLDLPHQRSDRLLAGARPCHCGARSPVPRDQRARDRRPEPERLPRGADRWRQRNRSGARVAGRGSRFAAPDDERPAARTGRRRGLRWASRSSAST